MYHDSSRECLGFSVGKRTDVIVFASPGISGQSIHATPSGHVIWERPVGSTIVGRDHARETGVIGTAIATEY